MRRHSRLPKKLGRIEIIPLIDIMFFLLASFMLVSLTMVKMRTIKMDLPTATQAKREFKPDIINVQVDRQGGVYIESNHLTLLELQDYLRERLKANAQLPVFISGDRQASHGDVINVLDVVRRSGIEKVSFSIGPPAPGQGADVHP